MSEYQYYEFRAIDRPLTDRQMRALRAISTRAAISRTSFSNHYESGELKANPRGLLVRYFDASLYFANWLFLELAFRYPKGAVDIKALRRYAAGHTVEIRSTPRDVLVAISLESDGESFDTAGDGSSWLSSLIALRADIASGDQRALYMAWLLDLQCGEIDDNAVEPGRPGGLGRLSPTLDSFVDIMGIDRDLIAAAAEVRRGRRRRPRRGRSSGGLRPSTPMSTWRCSPAWRVATGAWAPRSCVGLDGMRHGNCLARCERLAHCGHGRSRLLKRDVRAPSNARSANVRGVNASSK